ncbi:hypothetical protein [Halohasta salina]|uniref:hypothetical protein n=1 Tax=Halohasta salina TaxID=2961621 RepID=UPI0020A26074|nr:hypothetical protein [Halohasta salina]
MTRAGVRYAAGALAVAVAAIHIYWGFPRLVTQLQAGLVPDPRPALFVLSGIAILLGIARILDGHDPEPFYLAGIGLVSLYLVGYVAWHAFGGHGGFFWPWAPEPIVHDEPAAVVVAEHLLTTPLDLASKLLETVLLGLLVVLYRGEPQSTDEAIERVVGSD